MAEFHLNISPRTRVIIDRLENVYGEANKYRYNDSKRYRDIINAFYEEEAIRRISLLREVGDNKSNIRAMLEFMSFREHIVDVMTDWFWTFDTRLMTYGIPAYIPWIPWTRQCEFIEWLYNHYLNQKPGLIDKCRDQGVTWLMCAFYLQEWRWFPGFSGGFGSNKAESVDMRDNPKCIFEKMRALMRRMPSWWFPDGWSWKKCDKNNNLVNPETGSNVSGEAGDEIGRGGRTGIYTVDEAAALERPLAADAALSGNTTCQMDLSTPRGMNHFGQKRWSKRVDVFSFKWNSDPRKDIQWYESEKRRLDPAIFAQEVDLDYQSSVGGIFIRREWVEAAMTIKLDPVGPVSAGLDVAAGGSNSSALAIARGPCGSVKGMIVPNGVDLVNRVIDDCNEVGVDYLNYDKIGVGHAVHSVLERSERVIKFQAYPLEGSGKKSDAYYDELDSSAEDIFLNARAEWWWLAARRFERTHQHMMSIRTYPESELICLERDDELLAQLCAPRMIRTENGKIKCESKDSMKKRGVVSPDKADALVMAYVSRDGGRKHVVSDVGIMRSVCNFELNMTEAVKHNCLHYGSVCLTKDLSVECLFALWDEFDAKLYVYDELSADIPMPVELAARMNAKMHMTSHVIDKIVGNADMFEEKKRTFAKELNRSLSNLVGDVQTVKVREPRRYDPVGAIGLLNQMVKSGALVIHFRCKELRNQLVTWKLESGVVAEDGYRQGLLMIVSELVQVRPLKELMKRVEYKRVVDGRLYSEDRVSSVAKVLAEVKNEDN